MALDNALPCPFCGSTDLRVSLWCDDSGEFDAIECCRCDGAAPSEIWNSRAVGTVATIGDQEADSRMVAPGCGSA